MLPLVVPLVVAAALYVPSFDSFQVGAYMDDAFYIVTARALASGQGYALINYPDAPPQTTQPPGLPLLLVPVALLAPDVLGAYRIPSLLATLAALPLWLLLFRRRLPAGASYLLICALLSNALITMHATRVMSEAAFLFFLSALFVSLDLSTPEKSHSDTYFVGVGLLVTALYFVRTVGVVFFPAVVLYLLARRHVRGALITAITFAVPAAAWAYRNLTVGGAALSPGYEQAIESADAASEAAPWAVIRLARATEVIWHYVWYPLPDALGLPVSGDPPSRSVSYLLNLIGAPWLQQSVSPAVGVVLAGLILIGWWRQVRARPSFLEVGLAFYAAGLTAWPYPDTRLLYPVLPLLYLYLFCGLIGVTLPSPAALGHRLTLPPASALVVGALILVNTVRYVQIYTDPIRPRIPDLRPGATWIAQHTPSDSIVMTHTPGSRYLYTQRRTIALPETEARASAEAIEAIQQSGADYVLLAPSLTAGSPRALDPPMDELRELMAAHPDQFHLVYEDPDQNVHVFEVRTVLGRR